MRVCKALMLGFLAVAGEAGEAARVVASTQPGWPQWRGPRRDGISDEKGLLQEWPESGPKALWSVRDLGKGWSSPIIANGALYVTGDVGEDLVIFAFDLHGKPKWQAKNGRSWRGSYPGARGSCTYDEGRLYHINAHNRIACLDAADGKELWAVDVLQRFEGRNVPWAIAHHPLVDGSRVIVTPGGKKALMAALDKRTGETAWASEPLVFERTVKPGGGELKEPQQEADAPGYASPLLFELGGRRHLVSCSARHVFGVDADTGKLLWTAPMPTRYEVIANTPVLYKDCVFVTAPDFHGDEGGRLLRIVVEGEGVRAEELWRTDLDTCHGGLIALGDVFWGSWYRRYDGVGCIDALTGKTLHRTNELSMGSMAYADGRLYYLAQRGVMALLKPDPSDFRVVSRFAFPGGEGRRSDVWAHPVILDGRLYLRHHELLVCYDVKAR
ncbi:MAG TPA: PQQ-binding-like beta-propeller repeat protein [Planctomycetota bacterium]|nr:PQQ-binding-like beta-propeller repeat protein [Planctomycetota bacterium]HRR82810.1 PQQ-binding-like beta-propeller repeat protein [Planctomycetota bacterium]HRT97166.1 PQQ-binding-like beta-propeller repeat protein [Planctomycetota bacterium]